MAVVAIYVCPEAACVDIAILPADCQIGRPPSAVIPRMFCCALLLPACIARCEHTSIFYWLAEVSTDPLLFALLQTMDTTLSQVYEAIASSTVAAPTQPHSPSQIQEIILPPINSVVTAKRSMFTGLQKNIVN